MEFIRNFNITLVLVLIVFTGKAQKIEWLLPPEYNCEDIVMANSGDFDDFFWLIKKNGINEMIDEKGRVLIKSDLYKTKNPFLPGQKVFSLYNSKDEKYHFYNKDLVNISEGYDKIFYHPLYFTFITSLNDQLGLIDSDGKVLIPNNYSVVKRVSSTEVFLMTKEGEKLYVSIPASKRNDGQRSLQFGKYHVITDHFSNEHKKERGQRIFVFNGQDTLLKKNRFYVKFNLPDTIKDSLFVVYKNGLKGLINYRGEILLDPIATEIRKTYFPHFYGVQIDEKNAIFDTRNQKVTYIPNGLTLLRKSPFFIVESGAKKGLLNMQQQEVLPIEYDEILPGKKHFTLKKNNKYSVFNPKRNKFSKEEFDLVSNLRNSILVKYKKGSHYGLFNTELLTKVTEPVFYHVKSRYNLYHEGIENKNDTLAVENSSNKIKFNTRNFYSYFDNDGKSFVLPSFKKCYFLSKDIYLQYGKDSLMTFTNKVTGETCTVPNKKHKRSVQGAILLDGTYHSFLHEIMTLKEKAPKYDSLKLMNNKSTYAYKKNGLWGFRTANKIISDPVYDEIHEHYGIENKYVTKYKGKYGVLHIL